MTRTTLISAAAVMLLAGQGAAQSSSTFLNDPTVQTQAVIGPGGPGLSAAISSASFLAVGPPAPRQFSKHDLVTIIIRESVSLDNQASIRTAKDYEIEGEIAAFPRLTLTDLLNLQLNPSSMSGGRPKLDLSVEKDFTGNGQQRQSNSFTARITARIIDIKPNGTLVLEARKQVQADAEAYRMVLTGTCRTEDIAADNTILSTQLYDMALVKETKGEIRKATKKGLFGKILDTIIAF